MFMILYLNLEKTLHLKIVNENSKIEVCAVFETDIEEKTE